MNVSNSLQALPLVRLIRTLHFKDESATVFHRHLSGSKYPVLLEFEGQFLTFLIPRVLNDGVFK